MSHALTETKPPSPKSVDDTISTFRASLDASLRHAEDTAEPTFSFRPDWRLPKKTSEFSDFCRASSAAVAELGTYSGHEVRLLDLMRNPRTRTTKTLPSLVIVARAVAHVHATGERIMMLTPSSANKATALRDAVLRAQEAGLVRAEDLQIVSAVPEVALPKLWASPLSGERRLRDLNPLTVVPGATDGKEVKAFVKAVAEQYEHQLFDRMGIRLWHTMELLNYTVADALRYQIEQELAPRSGVRVHVHSVSSAFGLLGHHLGEQLATGGNGATPIAGYLLVQHLGTPDMVSHLYHGRFGYRPAYVGDADFFRQSEDPHWPGVTHAVDEQLDTTFYTHEPPTCEQMSAIIRARGGGGVVVSRHECLQRYEDIGARLEGTHHELPEDPDQLREWSLVMALTGAFNAVDRGLLAADDLLIHGSGSYSERHYSPLNAAHVIPISDAAELGVVLTRTGAHS